MVAIRSILGLFGKSKGAAKAVQESVSMVAARGTIVRPSLPGVTTMERQFGNSLFVSETRTLADGSKKTTTAVYGSNGGFIGKGGDQGLSAYRETTRTRNSGGSILGGDQVIINKNYHETMGMIGHNEKTVKEFTPEGILEHSTTTTKYNNWHSPKTTVYDRTKSMTGETAYSQAVEAKKAAEQAAKAEKEAAAAAALKAEQEAAAKLAAEMPRVNVGKVFNKNFDEFKKMQEEVLADGTVVRKYSAKGKGGSNQYIITKDRGNYHEEYIVDTAKDMHIKYSQLGKDMPQISMTKGMQLRQNGIKQIYNDGYQRIELDAAGNPGIFSVKGEGDQLVGGFERVHDINYGVMSRPYSPVDAEAAKNLKNLSADVHKEYVNLNGLFEPYQA